MVINISVQYNGGFLPDIILLTQGYYHWGTRLDTMSGACAPGKAPKVVLIGCEGRGWEAVSTCSAGGQSNLLQILPKMRCVWFEFGDDSNHRQKTVLYYSRLYYTVIQ